MQSADTVGDLVFGQSFRGRGNGGFSITEFNQLVRPEERSTTENTRELLHFVSHDYNSINGT